MKYMLFCVNTNVLFMKYLYLLKNDHTLLEFRRTWWFLTGAGVHDHVLVCSFDYNKLKFQVS